MKPKSGKEAIVDLAAKLTDGNLWPALPEVEKPSPEGRSGFFFSGVKNETYPERLMIDSRLTPIEKTAWLAFRRLLDKDGFAVPRYQELQPYLSMMPYGKKASRETVARALTILRLTRWLTLVTRGRDSVTGRIQGCMYLLNDEPVSVAEVVEIDASYFDLVATSMTHPNKSVRLVAEGAKDDVEESEGHLPTRLEIIAARMAEKSGIPDRREQRSLLKQESEPGETSLVRNIAPLSSESELGLKHPVRNAETRSSESELGQKQPSSESEPGGKPTKTDTVRNPNYAQYSTVLSTNTSTVRTVRHGDRVSELHWPAVIKLSDSEDREILNALAGLTPEVQQMVLDEAASRIAGGSIRSHSGYLFSIIGKAKAGTFKLWAANPRPDLIVATGNTSMTSSCAPGAQQQHNKNRGLQTTPEVARRCLDQLKAITRRSG